MPPIPPGYTVIKKKSVQDNADIRPGQQGIASIFSFAIALVHPRPQEARHFYDALFITHVIYPTTLDNIGRQAICRQFFIRLSNPLQYSSKSQR